MAKGISGSKYTTSTITKKGKPDKRTKLGGNYRGGKK